MKRILALILIVIMVLSICACGASNSTPTAANSTSAPTSGGDAKPSEAAPIAAVEGCEITKLEKDSFSFKVKVRNITEEDLDLTLNYQVLDANGDAIGNTTIGIRDVLAGQAVWSNNFSVKEVDLSEVDAISFVSTGHGSSKAPLQERMTYSFSELTQGFAQPEEGEQDPDRSERNIAFDTPVFLYEDERVKIELVSIFQNVRNPGKDDERVDRCIKIRVTNKTDRHWISDLESFYVDGLRMRHAMKDGNSGPDGGKSHDFRYIIGYDPEPGDPVPEHLETLLRGEIKMEFSIENEEETKIVDRFHVVFSYDATDQVG